MNVLLQLRESEIILICLCLTFLADAVKDINHKCSEIHKFPSGPWELQSKLLLYNIFGQKYL